MLLLETSLKATVNPNENNWSPQNIRTLPTPYQLVLTSEAVVFGVDLLPIFFFKHSHLSHTSFVLDQA